MPAKRHEWLLHPPSLRNKLPTILSAVWVAMIVISAAWNWVETGKFVTALAETEARSMSNKDLLYFRWVAMHGGVYVPTTDRTPSNPYLHVPDQDVITTSGKRLTLVNPAYMTRLVFGLGKEQYVVQSHITSLKPFRPENAPDAWEARALHSFEAGVKEVVSREIMDGETYLRLMRPMYVEKGCLKCHAVQGCKIGDVRGGISVSVPLASYAAAVRKQRLKLMLAHLLFGCLGLIGLWTGFARLRRYTDALKEREEQLQTLINSTPDIICFKDGQGRWLEANDADLELFSLTDVDYRGKTDSELAEFTDPIYRQAFLACEASDEKAWQAGDFLRSEEVIPKSDGTEKVYDVIKVPLFEADGTRKGLVILGRDITERKRAEADHRMLMSAIEQTTDSIVITDTKGTIQYVNSAFECITGYAREEAIGQNPRILKSGKQDEVFYRELWATISGGKIWQGRMTNKRKDGSFFTEDATISPVYNNDGTLWRYMAIKRDVTEHIRLYEEKFRLKEQLQQAQKLESLGRLAGGVAHDLNNLLTPILGYCELLLNDLGENYRHKASVKQIAHAGMRARDIVRQLLVFSRRQTIEMKPVNLNKVLTGFEKLIRRTIREDIAIKLALAPSLPLMMGDIGQLAQVIMNLVVNAQDAMPDGGMITMETMASELDDHFAATHQGVKPGLYVMLSVSDTGCGMDAETREHIFEPFFTTKDKDRGTGLGLATVYGIVKQHGGNIWVYSEPGKGTTFKIYLPVFRGTYTPEKNKSGAELAALNGNETILLVEDDKPVRDLALDVLRNLGYTVLNAASGEEAIAILDRHDKQIHLLLTDVIMPGMNGKELFAKVAEKHQGLKVIYMSGYTENVIAHHGVLEEGIVFIQKPFTVQDFAAKIRKVLNQ